MKTRILLIALGLCVWQAQAANIISLNLAEADNNAVLPNSEAVGPLATSATTWNNTNDDSPNTYAAGSLSDLIDDNGNSTGVGVTWLSTNVWYTLEGNTPDNRTVSCGYLDDGATSGGYGVQVSFSNIPYAAYKVYGLYATDQDERVEPPEVAMRNFLVNGVWVLGGDSTTTATAYGTVRNNETYNEGAHWTEIDPGVTVGNYWTIDTSGDTLTINGLPRNGSQRGCLTGVIIQEIPEPGTLSLLGLAGLGLLIRRRA